MVIITIKGGGIRSLQTRYGNEYLKDVGNDPEQCVEELYDILNELRNRHIPKFQKR